MMSLNGSFDENKSSYAGKESSLGLTEQKSIGKSVSKLPNHQRQTFIPN